MAETALAARVRSALGGLRTTEKKMFGGICFLLNGNMLVGASPRGLLVRVGKDGNAAALSRPGVRPMEQSHRRIPGYVVVTNEATRRDQDLRSWLDLAVAHVKTLPAKTKIAAKPKAPAKAKAKPKK